MHRYDFSCDGQLGDPVDQVQNEAIMTPSIAACGYEDEEGWWHYPYNERSSPSLQLHVWVLWFFSEHQIWIDSLCLHLLFSYNKSRVSEDTCVHVCTLICVCWSCWFTPVRYSISDSDKKMFRSDEIRPICTSALWPKVDKKPGQDLARTAWICEFCTWSRKQYMSLSE